MGTVMLDRERPVNLTLGAMKRFKALTGKNFMKIKQLDELEPEDLAALIFACLGPNTELTLEEVDELVNIKNVGEVFTSIIGEATKEADPLASSGP